MEAYRSSLTGENATLMVEPDRAFFLYVRSPDGAPPAPPPASGDAPEAPAQSTRAGLND